MTIRSNRRGLRHTRQHQAGMTLLEVMIAVVILGFGLLGLGVLQGKSIAMGQSSYFRGIAADMGNDLAERIRAQRTPFMVNAAAAAQPPKPPDFSKCTASGATVTCTAQDADRVTNAAVVQLEMQEWFDALRAQLPSASYSWGPAGTTVASASPNFLRYTLTITWLDNRQDNSTSSYSVVIE